MTILVKKERKNNGLSRSDKFTKKVYLKIAQEVAKRAINTP
jgi:hypothetical protein